MITLVNAMANRIPLSDNSVHCVATSPPYWGLRDYGLPPRIWDGEPGCRHVWGEEEVNRRGGGGERDYGSYDGGVGRGPAVSLPSSQFCQLCGAWCGCLGLEPTIELYVSHLVDVFREVRRVLHPSGTVWLNIGDSYAGSWGNYAPGGIKGKQRPQTEQGQRWERGAYDDTRFLPPTANAPGLKPKDLCMIPARVALALQADGWWLRSQIIWHKPNCMPESVTDRPTTAHEYVFLLAKRERYFYDQEAVREPHWYQKPEYQQKYAAQIAQHARRPMTLEGNGETASVKFQGEYKDNRLHENPSGRNHRTVWTIPTAPYAGAHFATFPPALVEPMIKAGSSERGVCPECLAPWERVVEHVGCRKTHGVNNVADDARSHEPMRDNGTRHGTTSVMSTGQVGIYDTTGWRSTCDHDHDPIPATVLDPFCGSGTTLQVARQLGRRGIGLDLSYDYLHDQARERLGFVALDEWEHGKNGKEGEPLEELPLFEGLIND